MPGSNAVPFIAGYRRVFIILLASGLCLNTYLLWAHRWDIAKGYPDFTIFYSAADIVRSGHGKSLYNEQVQYLAQLAVAPDVKSRSWALPYNHPPFEALLFVPLSYLPYGTAYIAWAALNIAMLWVAAKLLSAPLCLPSNLSAGALFAPALIFFPAFITVFQGQDLLLMLLIASATYALIKRDNDFLAGCSLGLGLFRPELALPMALLLMLVRGRRFATGFLVTAAAVVLISSAVVGWHGLIAYPDYVWHMERVHGYGSIVPAVMPNLRGLIALLFHDRTIRLVLTALTSLAVFAISAQQLRLAKIMHSTERIFSLTVLCSLLISFHALVHDLTLLIIPVMFVCAELADPRQSLNARERRILFWPVLFFFCTPVLLFLWLGIGTFSLVALALVIWLWGVLAVLKHLPTRRIETVVLA